MFGGTDDTSELNDFWMFDVKENEWSEIECMNGPTSPRSGCKMVFDPVGNQLFILGKKSPRGSDNQKVLKKKEFFEVIRLKDNFFRATFIYLMSRDDPGF